VESGVVELEFEAAELEFEAAELEPEAVELKGNYSSLNPGRPLEVVGKRKMVAGWEAAEAERTDQAEKVRLTSLALEVELAGLVVEARWALLQEPDLG
jgi:hypothetical protein